MVVTEFVRSHFKPATAQEAFGAVGKSFRVTVDKAPGVLFRRVGLLVKENGVDVSDKHSVVLGLEWESPEAFHAFFPATPEFQEFIKTVVPYASQKSTPQLFTPSAGYNRSAGSLDSNLTQIFKGPVGSEKKTVESAWEQLVTALQKEGSVEHWSGWGIEESAEGSWAGVIGWKSPEEFDRVTKNSAVIEALSKLQSIGELDSLIVKFEE